ncbi:translation initiation factor eIF-2B [Haloferax larsenii]|uniref:Translation initiation factor eIF-2B n=1 Tax=Haloferax larsenii TaxID=302484 RepID=A0ABY5RCV7_HALLR|nr:translation initiation factor eIF-2B [Haloferax larsenii]ELZ78528.1 initiation factor 2B-like protein [Haloferax larsenii JCM 13917]UVE50201.1 translation initiation factor eIF-2B [Haloferax larsenii]
MIDETIEEIREMQTHSSSVVAVKAAQSLAELTERDYVTVEEFERDLERNVSALKRANPSHASLYNALQEVLNDVQGEADDIDEARERTLSTIDRVVEKVETGKHRAAKNAAETFEDGTTFLTHDYSSTVMEAVELAVEDGADLHAYVTEARPRFLGRKFARELAAIDGVEPHLMVDGASGLFLPKCDRVVIGMDCIVDETLYNRVGTFPLVAAANEVGVPVTVVGSSAKLVDGGFRFENEIRSPSEVMLEPVEGIELENPAYDATPVDLIDEVITDEGVVEY